jgi:uncharacterized RmlC-like cupin family protein
LTAGGLLFVKRDRRTPARQRLESGLAYTSGALFYAPKGVRHGPHVARTEVVNPTIFDGSLTVV